MLKGQEIKKSSVRILFAALIAYIIFMSFLSFNQRKLIYHPVTDRPAPSHYGLSDVDVITVETQDNLSLKGWYKSAKSENAPVMVVFHGNAGHIGFRSHLMKLYTEAGMGVLLAEYRGYGGNPGDPSEQGLYMDAQAYLDHLVNKMNIAEQSIVLYGESLGTGVAVEAATKYNIAALVLEAPYDSMVSLAQTHYSYIPFIEKFMIDHYNSIDIISSVDAPVLFLVAGEDRIIPNSSSKALFEKAKQPKVWHGFPQAGHNNFYHYGADKVVQAFLKKHEFLK